MLFGTMEEAMLRSWKQFMIRRTAALLALAFLAVLFGATSARASSGGEDYALIRVRLSLGDPERLEIRVKGIYTCSESGLSFADGTLLLTAKGSQITVSHSSLGAIYTGTSVHLERLAWNRRSGYLRFAVRSGTRSYLGNILFTSENGKMKAVNTVPMTQYLYGVVGHEMADSFPLEALKAQAVAAKCYALRSVGSHSEYDIGDTASDQVYRGYTPENARVIAACDAVNQYALYFNGQVMSCYYAASNGGYTKLPSSVWEGRAMYDGAYAEVPDPYDMQNPSSPRLLLRFPSGFWGDRVREDLYGYVLEKTRRKLEKESLLPDGYHLFSLLSADSLLSVDSADRTDGIEHSKAILSLTAILAQDDPDTIPAARTAAITPPDSVPPVQEDASPGEGRTRMFHTVSVLLELPFQELVKEGLLKTTYRVTYAVRTNEGYALQNCRYGHGVGMSQRGAQQMAKLGFTFREILSFYYPGAELRTLAVSSPENDNPVSSRSSSPFSAAEASGSVGSASVHLRKAPSTSADSVTVLSSGTSLILTGIYGDWYAVRVPSLGLDGYCHKAYIREYGQNPVALGRVTASSVNMRSGPGTKHSAVGKLEEDTLVGLLGMDGDWYHVILPENNLTGYVIRDYLSVTEHTLSAAGSSYPTPSPAPAVSDLSPEPDLTDRILHAPVPSWKETSVPARLLSNSFLYASPCTDGDILLILHRREEVRILSKEGVFCFVSAGEVTGYVPVSLLSSSYDRNGSALPQGYVSSGGAVLYSEPDICSEKLSVLASDRKVSVLAMEGGWYLVEDHSGCVTGYVLHRNIRLFPFTEEDRETFEICPLLRDADIRLSPSMEKDNVISHAEKGSLVRLVGTEKGWCLIGFSSGLFGFVPEACLRKAR